MLAEGRNQVLWVGLGPVAPLEAACEVLGYSVEYVIPSEIRPFEQPRLRAILFPFEGKGQPRTHQTLMQLLRANVLDYGVLLAIVSGATREAYALRAGLIKAAHLESSALPVVKETTSELARLLREHNPGPPADPLISIDVVGGGDPLADDDCILLRRAFHSFTKLTLVSEHGGRSTDCRVWRVTAEGGIPRCEAFIAKTAPLLAVQTERDNYRTYVHDQIPFPFRAPLVSDRCVTGGVRGVLVSMFVGRAQRIDKYLASGGSPHAVITSLFTDALGSWRAHEEQSRASIGRILVERQQRPTSDPAALALTLLPDPNDLSAIRKECLKTDKNAPTPKQLFRRLKKLPVLEFHNCHAHGDLNIRNVFVRWNSTDAILIDFEKSRYADPMARDLSKLETSIALTAEDSDKRYLPLADLERLFKHPLLPPSGLGSSDDTRISAIRQIRRHACGEGITNAEYEILTICHLLRFAVPPKNPTDQTRLHDAHRPKCYELAHKLLSDLEASH